jgi:hypothetical protein
VHKSSRKILLEKQEIATLLCFLCSSPLLFLNKQWPSESFDLGHQGTPKKVSGWEQSAARHEAFPKAGLQGTTGTTCGCRIFHLALHLSHRFAPEATIPRGGVS